jgi:hypothetical protein
VRPAHQDEIIYDPPSTSPRQEEIVLAPKSRPVSSKNAPQAPQIPPLSNLMADYDRSMASGVRKYSAGGPRGGTCMSIPYLQTWLSCINASQILVYPSTTSSFTMVALDDSSG